MSRLLAFLRDRAGYDAIHARAVIVVLVGVTAEVAAVILALGLYQGFAGQGLTADALASLAVLGAFVLATASLGYGLAHLAGRALGLQEVAARIVALLTAPLGLPLIAAAVLAARSIAKTRVNAQAVFGGAT